MQNTDELSFILNVQYIIESHDLKSGARFWPGPSKNY